MGPWTGRRAGDTPSGERPALDDARLQVLFLRYGPRNSTATLDGAEQARWQQQCQERWQKRWKKRWHHGVEGRLTRAQFFGRVDALSQTTDEHREARCMRRLIIGGPCFLGLHLVVKAGGFDEVMAPSHQGSADAARRLLSLRIRASEIGSG